MSRIKRRFGRWRVGFGRLLSRLRCGCLRSAPIVHGCALHMPNCRLDFAWVGGVENSKRRWCFSLGRGGVSALASRNPVVEARASLVPCSSHGDFSGYVCLLD